MSSKFDEQYKPSLGIAIDRKRQVTYKPQLQNSWQYIIWKKETRGDEAENIKLPEEQAAVMTLKRQDSM